MGLSCKERDTSSYRNVLKTFSKMHLSSKLLFDVVSNYSANSIIIFYIPLEPDLDVKDD